MKVEDVKFGRPYHFRGATFYAASGSIVFHDDRKEKGGSVNIMSVATFKERAEALQARLTNIDFMTDMSPWAIELRRDTRKLLDEMSDCIREAQEQGDPMDAQVQRWYKKHKPWKGGRVSLANSGGVVANSTDAVSYEVSKPGPLPLGEFTGRTA